MKSITNFKYWNQPNTYSS